MDKDKDKKEQIKLDTEKLIKIDLQKEPIEKKKPNWFKRKGKKIQKSLSEFWMLGKTGFMMGGLVGVVMGFLGGCVSAYSSKSLLPIPIAMCASGMFFGSLMGVGACLRSESIVYDKNNKPIAYYAIAERNGKSVLIHYKFTDLRNLCSNDFKLH
jgi:hypothetical protein